MQPPSDLFPPEVGDTQGTMAHVRKGGLQCNHALSRLSGLPGPLPLMLPSNLATALRRKLGDNAEVRVHWEAVANGTLLVLLHRCGAGGYRWDALLPQFNKRHAYVSAALEHPRTEWDNIITAFHDHEVHPTDT